jgi:hypothetical protein
MVFVFVALEMMESKERVKKITESLDSPAGPLNMTNLITVCGQL